MASHLLRSVVRVQGFSVRSYSMTRTVFAPAAGGASKTVDPIQQLFVDKLREYAKSAVNTKDGLFEATEQDRKAIVSEEENLKKRFGDLDLKAVSSQLIAPHPEGDEPSTGNPLATLDPISHAKTEVTFDEKNFMFYDLNLPQFMWPEEEYLGEDESDEEEQ